MKIADKDYSQCYVGSPQLTSILNDYTVVVQEYFQMRVEIWLQTVSKDVFGIKHYWVRYKFASGRGQIHAHLLAISEDNSIYKLCHRDTKQPGGTDLRDKRLSDWASEKFGLTASVQPGFDDIKIEEKTTNNPCAMRFIDLQNDPKEITLDGQRLLKFCQSHVCNKYCLRTDSNKRYVPNVDGVRR